MFFKLPLVNVLRNKQRTIGPSATFSRAWNDNNADNTSEMVPNPVRAHTKSLSNLIHSQVFYEATRNPCRFFYWFHRF